MNGSTANGSAAAHQQAFHRAVAPSSPPVVVAGAGSFAGMRAASQGQAAPAVPFSGSAGSPTASYAGAGSQRARSISIPGKPSSMPRLLTPFDQGDIRILLLENVSQGAVDMLRQQGYQVDFHAKAWSEDELCDKIGQYHAIGIRSKTKLTAKVFRRAEKVRWCGSCSICATHTPLRSCCSSAASASARTRST